MKVVNIDVNRKHRIIGQVSRRTFYIKQNKKIISILSYFLKEDILNNITVNKNACKRPRKRFFRIRFWNNPTNPFYKCTIIAFGTAYVYSTIQFGTANSLLERPQQSVLEWKRCFWDTLTIVSYNVSINCDISQIPRFCVQYLSWTGPMQTSSRWCPTLPATLGTCSRRSSCRYSR